MNIKDKFSFSAKQGSSVTKQEDVYDASKPFSPRIPVVNLIPQALVMRYDKLNLIRKVSLILLGIVVVFAGLWGVNFALAGVQGVTSSAIQGEITALQGQVAKVEPYQKYLEGIELTRSNMSKVFAKNVDMSKVMGALVSNGAANGITLSSIKITEINTTTEQNTCINSNPFDELEQVGCINLSGTAADQSSIIAFFDALGQTEGLANAFITSMGNGGSTILFSGSISMTEDIYVSNLSYLKEDIDKLLKQGGLTLNSSQTVATPTVTATPKPTASSTATPAPTATAKTVNDTRFATCEEAVAAGFGPYVQGTDPEYEWYKAEDTGKTGKVCIA